MAQKTGIPKGTRDFGPKEMARRNYIFNTIKEVYQLYGFQAIETPAMENLTTLMGKYGEEGDKLLFRILNSGNFLSKVSNDDTEKLEPSELSARICEKGLRYDLTVPFARYVVQHRNEISFPFKRYQVQPVWRADRPQKGRYREFYQCDADVVGSNSLLNELELVQIIDEVFSRLNLNVAIKVNNRKILAGIAEYIDAPDNITDVTVAIDKLDKIGIEKVNAELLDKGLAQKSVDMLQPILQLEGTNTEKLETISSLLTHNATAQKGIEEMRTVLGYIDNANIACNVEFDLTLARGLNYYTGAIFEVKSLDISIGSICGGGRYDDLTGIFGLKDVSGVGISFGADRIYDVLEETGRFPAQAIDATKVMFVNFGEKEEAYCLPLLSNLRKAGINSEIFPDSAKMKKQMNYANNKGILYVVLAGENEMEQGMVTLKNMKTGEQQKIMKEDITNKISE